MAEATNRTLSPVRLVACCALVCLWACPLDAAFAQEPFAPDVKEDAVYRANVKDALAEYDARHFEEARILFRHAHELQPNARTLRGIGMASFELRDYVSAVRALSAALQETNKALSPEQRAHAQGLLERSQLFVDAYTLKITPPDARVLVDARPPDSESDGTVLLGFGPHSLEVSKPGYHLRTFTVDVRGGERKELIMTLERKLPAVPLPAVAPAAATGGQKLPAAPPADGPRSGAGWLLAGGAAGLLGVGAGTLWIFENDQLSSCLNAPEGLRCKNQHDIETKRNMAVGATLVAGAAAVTMAIIGIVSGPSAPNASARSSLACSVVPSGVVCSTAF